MPPPLFISFASYPQLVCAFSRRSDGTMTAAGDATRQALVAANRERYFRQLGINPAATVRGKQVHGHTVAAVTARQRGTIVRDVDGLVTATPNVFLTVTVADCLPIFFYDPVRRVLGLAHGGWRSLRQGIVGQVVGTMGEKFRASVKKLMVGIGPGLGPCHFIIGPDVASKFRAFPSVFRQDANGTLYLDLPQVAALQLQMLGVRREHIEISPECTACLPELYLSYRRDKPAVVEAMVAVIGLCA